LPSIIDLLSTAVFLLKIKEKTMREKELEKAKKPQRTT
jgi:hypothetical protein